MTSWMCQQCHRCSALCTVRDVVVDAPLSVERRQRVKEVALTRVIDARGTEDLSTADSLRPQQERSSSQRYYARLVAHRRPC